MSYRGLVLPPAAAAFVGRGGRDLPLGARGGDGAARGREAAAARRPDGRGARPRPRRPRERAPAGDGARGRGLRRDRARPSSPRGSSARSACGGRSASSASAPPAASSTARATACPASRWTSSPPGPSSTSTRRAFVPHGQLVARAAIEQAGLRGVVVKVRSRGAASQQTREAGDGRRGAAFEQLVVEELGVPFELHPTGGLNAGLFTDMREHRHRLARLAAGRAVLNGFAYTGSLSVLAARGGATLRDERGFLLGRAPLGPGQLPPERARPGGGRPPLRGRGRRALPRAGRARAHAATGSSCSTRRPSPRRAGRPGRPRP